MTPFLGNEAPVDLLLLSASHKVILNDELWLQVLFASNHVDKAHSPE
jgi:hypothetical protein